MAQNSHTTPNENWVDLCIGPGIITIKNFGNANLFINMAQSDDTAMIIQPADNENQIHVSASSKIYARASSDESQGWQLILHNEA